MQSFRRFAAVALGASTLTISLAAGAEPRSQAPASSYSYDFEPDDLVGETLANTPPLLTVRPRPGRILLLRPRASFVPDLLKSVEVL